MKMIPLAALLLASPALADHHGKHEGHADHAKHSDHANHANHADHAKTDAEAAKFTIDMPIEKLMADEKAKAVVVKNFGGQNVSQHPMYPQFKAMSLKDVAPFSQGMITDDMLAKIAAELAAL